MYTATENKKENNKIILPSTMPWQVAKGHNSHRSGAGTHADRRTQRLRTRAAQQRAAVNEG